MSWLSGIGSGIKNAAVGAGHAVGNVASNPWTKAALAAGLAATGVGAPAAAAIMGGTGLLGGALHEGGGLHDAITGGASGAAEGYGAAKAGGLLRGALGIGQAAGGVGSGPNAGDPTTGDGGFADASAPGAQGADSGGGGFDWQSLLKGAGSSLLGGAAHAVTGGGIGGMSPAVLALAGLQGANAAQLGAKANQYADNAMTTANDSWNARAGLRSQGIAGLQAPRPMQSLSGLSAIRAQNPVAARAGLPATTLGG